jgi:energy-coupling factor transporter transmembrane protein EcfT
LNGCRRIPIETLRMHIGQYIPGDSMIHRLDPRVKLGSTIVLSILILKGGGLTGAVISAFLIALIPLSRLSIDHMARAFRPVLIFFALLFFVHLLFTDGKPIPPFPPWRVTITYEGLHRGAVTTWQFALLIWSASILTMTTSPTELVSGIERLLRPLKRLGVPSHDLAMMVSVALRFVPTFLEEIDRIKAAQMARGASFGSGPFIHRTRAAISLLLPLVLCAVRRADELVTAMEARGYRRGPRTYMKELSMGRADYAAMMVMILMTGLLVIG